MSQNQKVSTALVAIAAALIALFAIAALPYGYYSFARVAITVASISLVVIVVRAKQPGWSFGLVPIAVLWNPVFPVYLTRATWLPLDVIAALFLVTLSVVVLSKPVRSDRTE